MLKLLAFTLPLCLDNFAIAFAVLGEIRLTRAQLLRVTLVFIAFEAIMPLIGFAVGTPLIHLIAGPPHITIDPYQLGSPTELKELQLAYRSHLADTVDLTFVGRYIVPFVVPVVVGVLGILMLDEAFNDDDDDDEAEKARALVAARGRRVPGLCQLSEAHGPRDPGIRAGVVAPRDLGIRAGVVNYQKHTNREIPVFVRGSQRGRGAQRPGPANPSPARSANRRPRPAARG